MKEVVWIENMSLRQKLYDHYFGDVNLPMSTPNLYYQFLQRMKHNTKILDIGMGTGIYFSDQRCVDLIRSKNIKIVGIDINEADIILASKRIQSAHIGDHVEAKFMDLFEYSEDLYRFDVILFS